MIRIGCSGWNYDSWRGNDIPSAPGRAGRFRHLYPEGMGPARWLREYSRHFDTVEVNSTFYRLASRNGVERWVSETPDDFCFAVKGSRYLTHVKRLSDDADKGFSLGKGIARFYERITPLIPAGKLGPVLWQLPPTFKRDDERLVNLLELVPPGRHCVEFRHPSWFADGVYELLRQHGAALVIADRPELTFQTHELTADWTFVRFHHGHRGRRGNYSRSELEEWAPRIAGWHESGTDVYAYFNNDWEVFAPRNAATLKRLLDA